MPIKLKTVVPNLDDIADEQKEFYVEKEGQFVLDVEGIDEHPAVAALKNALERQKSERRQLATDLAALKEKGKNVPEDFDLDKYNLMVAELEELKSGNKGGATDDERRELATARKALEQKISNMEKSHSTEIAKKELQIKKLDGKIHQLLIDEGLTKSLVEAGVGKEYIKAAKALLKGDCTVIEEDGDYRAVVESDMGQLDIGKYVTDWVASDEGKVFIPPAKGGDANNQNKPSQRINTDKNPWAKDTWNLTEQGRILTEDRSKAEKLAKSVGKTVPPAAA
jgi:hypothetical protein